jgi:thiol-disulfide isomerase/thioredoxin
MKKTVLFVFLSLIPFFTWGHFKYLVGIGSSYYYYTAIYFLLGSARNWVDQPAWRHHLIAITPMALLSLVLITEDWDVYFPIYTPLLFLAGLLSYWAGWKAGRHKAHALAILGLVATTLGIWRYYLPQIIDFHAQEWHEEKLYRKFVGLKPELRFEHANGQPTLPEEFRNKVVVLDFWFSGCGYCLDKFKSLNTVKQHFANDPRVVFASVADGNLDDRAKFAEMLVKYPHITKPALYDPQGQFVNRYGIAKYGYSFELDLDHQSTVYAVFSGTPNPLARQLYAERLIRQVEAKLKEIPQ